MTKKQLQEYRWLKKSIKLLEEELEELKSSAEKMIPILKHDVVQEGLKQDQLGDIIAKMYDVEQKLQQEIRRSYIVLDEIETAVSKLPGRERYLISARYVALKPWEKICVDMNYSWKQIHNIHSKALKILAG